MKIFNLTIKFLLFASISVQVMSCGTSSDQASIPNAVITEPVIAAISTVSSVSPDEAGKSPQDPASESELVTSDNFEYAIIQVLRGDPAWNILKVASAFNKLPEDASLEYILVKIHIRSLESNDQTLSIDPAHIEGVIDSNGELFERPSVVEVKNPDPFFQAELAPGAEAEGWVTVLAPKNDTNLVLVIKPRINGVSVGDQDTRYISLQ